MPAEAVQRLLDRLQGVHSNGDRWQALCPAHADKNASLSIAEGQGGCCLLRCFAGCSVEAIVAALGLTMRDLFSGNGSGNSGPARTAKPKSPLSVAPVLHPLSDEARKWLAENGKGHSEDTLTRFKVQETTVRGEPAIAIPAEGGVLRLYFWRRPNKHERWQSWPTGAGGSVVKGELDGSDVLACEGEWDALAAYDHGFKNLVTGTTGAGSFPKTYLPLFEGKTVTICYDNDPPGRKGAEKLAGEIAEACPKAKVRIAEIPAGSWEGSDVSDYLNAGNTADDFKEVLASARSFQPRVAIGFHFDTGAELLALKIEEPPHIIKTLLPEQGQTMIAAEGGVGKSMLTLELALAVATGGKDFLGFEIVRPVKVCIVSLENSRLLTAARLQRMARGRGISAADLAGNLVTVHDLRLDLSIKTDRARLLKIAEQVGAGLFIFDPIVSFMGGADEKDNVKVRGVLDTFTQLNRALGAASIVVHHFNKPSGDSSGKLAHRIRGASDYLNWCDSTLALERQSPPQAIDAVLKVSLVKTRALREPAPFLVERSSSTFLHRRIEDAALCSSAKLAAILRDTFDGQCEATKELVAKAIQQTGCSDKTAKDALREAKKAGLIESADDPDDGRRKILVLREIGIGEKGKSSPNPLPVSRNQFK